MEVDRAAVLGLFCATPLAGLGLGGALLSAPVLVVPLFALSVLWIGAALWRLLRTPADSTPRTAALRSTTFSACLLAMLLLGLGLYAQHVRDRAPAPASASG